MQVWLFVILSSSSSCFCFTNSPSSLNSSSSHFPLSIPRPLLPYFQSVSKASKRQPRQEMTIQVDESDFEIDSNTEVEASLTPVEAGTRLKVDNLTLQENLGLRVPAAVREHYMKGRSGRQIVPGVYSCGHQVATDSFFVTIFNPALKYFLCHSLQACIEILSLTQSSIPH